MIDFLGGLVDLQGMLLIALVFLPFERLLPRRREQRTLRPGWQIDTFYFFLNRIPVGIGLIGIVLLSAWAGQALLPAPFRAAVAAQPLWLQTIELVVVADLLFYAVHRLFHAIPFLWRFHAVHHSIEDLDWLAAFRVHPVDQILTKGVSLIPCFMMGFSPSAIGLSLLFYKWHSLLLHSNIRVDFGPLRWVIASPTFHHWHHADEPDAWDRNFAGQLPLWDLLFGTANMPAGRMPSGYGIAERLPNSYLQQMLHPFRRGRADDFASAGSGVDRAEKSSVESLVRTG